MMTVPIRKSLGRPSALLPGGHSRACPASRADVEAPAPIVRWTFYVFVFSVPLLHTVLVGEDTRLSKVMGGFLLLAALLQPRICFRWFPAALWCFAAYTGVFAVLGAFQKAGYDDD